jgi:hypothetical protein
MRSRFCTNERRNRSLGALRCGHSDDGEAASAAAFALNREIDLGDIAMSGDQALQLLRSWWRRGWQRTA